MAHSQLFETLDCLPAIDNSPERTDSMLLSLIQSFWHTFLVSIVALIGNRVTSSVVCGPSADKSGQSGEPTT